MKSSLVGLTFLAALPLASLAALAQESVDINQQMSAAQSTTPTIQVYSRETIVDVLVTDDRGKPVTGLKRSDFTITEDDQPRPLRGFQETSKATSQAATPEPGSPTAPALPPNTYSNAHTLPTSGPVQILYYGLPCPPLKPIPAIGYIQDYLRTMPAGTQVAIFGYRADIGLRLVHGFTTDGPLAAAAIDNLILPVCTIPSADPIAAANQIAAYAAGVHGRKNLIWLARPLLPIMRDGGLAWSIAGSPDMLLTHRLMDTYDHFTQEQIAVYPFDGGGVRAPSANITGDLVINGTTGARFAATQMANLTGIGFGNLRADSIAEATGGSAIYNTNDFKGAFAKVVNDTTHYYTLSYVPPRATDDGHYHAIKITVDRPHLHLNYRGGYNSEQPRPPDNVLAVHMTQATMGLGSLPATQLLFDAAVTPEPASTQPPSPRKVLALAGKTPVPYDVLFTLDPKQFSWVRGADDQYIASLEFDLVAYGPEEKILTQRSQTLKLPLTPEEYIAFLQTPFKFFQAIDLTPGPVTLRLGVFDTLANKTGTVEIPLTIPKAKPTPASATTANPASADQRSALP